MSRRRSASHRRASCSRALAIGALGLALAAPGAAARADDATEQARAEFVSGADLVKRSQWAEALAAFERSVRLRPHAVTTFNIGYCHRALGRYTRARASFVAALEEEAQRPGELPPNLQEEIRGYLAEIERLLVRLHVTLVPATASVAVDGRALVASASSATTLVAGLGPVGDGAPAPASKFDLVVDPGPRIVTLRRKGFSDAVVSRTFAPGWQGELELTLDRLPATLEITSTRPAAVVSVAGLDVGTTPLSLSRPAGTYRVVVRSKGFVPYDAQVTLQPGEATKIRAKLVAETPALYERWWFWAGAAVVVGGVVGGTYLATRPAPERPPLEGGTLGWAVEVP